MVPTALVMIVASLPLKLSSSFRISCGPCASRSARRGLRTCFSAMARVSGAEAQGRLRGQSYTDSGLTLKPLIPANAGTQMPEGEVSREVPATAWLSADPTIWVPAFAGMSGELGGYSAFIPIDFALP